MQILNKVREIDRAIRKVGKGKIGDVALIANVPEPSVREYILLLKEEGELIELSNSDKEFELCKTKQSERKRFWKKIFR